MAINSTHPTYDDFVDQWRRCRDVADGSDAVKERGEEYLPRLSKQTPPQYSAYKMRAFFYEATGRTLEGMSGTVFRKPMTIEAPTAAEGFLADPMGVGLGVEEVARMLFDEVMTVGRVSLYVTLPATASPNPAPYLVIYPSEALINWRTSEDNRTLTLAVLKEAYLAYKEDGFSFEEKPQYRVLSLDEAGNFLAQVYRQQEGAPQDRWISVQQIFPTARGKTLERIPLFTITPRRPGIMPVKPVILGLVDANLDHYRLTADYRHGLHWCGLPTPVATGVPADTILTIGPSEAWIIPDAQGSAYMLEFTGQGLAPLEKAIEHNVDYMASLGARLLEQPKKSVESSDTHKLRQSGEESIVKSVARAVGSGLSAALTFAWQWANPTNDEIRVSLNTDLLDIEIDATYLREVVAGWQGGAYSYETMYYQLKRGEFTRPGVEAEEERELISIQTPATSILAAEENA
jgi:hypothetical protein